MKRSGSNIPNTSKVPRYMENVASEEQSPWSFQHSVQLQLPEDTNKPSTSEAPKQLVWKPKFESLDELLNGDLDTSDDLDINLGSSILFDNGGQFAESQETEDHDNYELEETEQEEHEKVSAPHLIRAAVNDLFNENPHPTVSEMLQLSDQYSIRYRSVFENLEKKRISRGVLCDEGDTCCKIREWIERESEPTVWPRMSQETKELLEAEIEAQIKSRKRFDIGCVHLVLEKTNLTPAFVRSYYTKWRQRLWTNNRMEFTIQEWRENFQNRHGTLPMETIRTLEQMYISKKYMSSEKEWSTEELRDISFLLNGLSPDVILRWLEKRSRAVEGLQNCIVVPRRSCSPSRDHPVPRIIPPHKVNIMLKEFEKNERPEKWKISEMATKLELPEKTVANFFTKKRRLVQRDKAWEAARQDVMNMAPDRVQMLERVAADKRKTAAEYMEIADRIGVSHSTLSNFVSWRKSAKARNNPNFRYPSLYSL